MWRENIPLISIYSLVMWFIKFKTFGKSSAHHCNALQVITIYHCSRIIMTLCKHRVVNDQQFPIEEKKTKWKASGSPVHTSADQGLLLFPNPRQSSAIFVVKRICPKRENINFSPRFLKTHRSPSNPRLRSCSPPRGSGRNPHCKPSLAPGETVKWEGGHT